ncbi:hypothetical protein D1P53_005091 [Cryptococcus gattii VGV]|nr:hypothetical protein D1P53_005091 [Cryptococcus gattii VGV]
MTDIPTDHDCLAFSLNSTLPSGNGYALITISSGNMKLSKMYFAVEDGQEIAFAQLFTITAGRRSGGSPSSGKSSSSSKKIGNGVSILSLSPMWFCSLGRLADRLFGFRRMLLEPEGPSDEAERISNERPVGQVVLAVGLAIADLV